MGDWYAPGIYKMLQNVTYKIKLTEIFNFSFLKSMPELAKKKKFY